MTGDKSLHSWKDLGIEVWYIKPLFKPDFFISAGLITAFLKSDANEFKVVVCLYTWD